MTTFVLTNQIIGEYENEQAIQHLQGGTRLGVLRLAKRLRRLPVGVLYEGHAAAEVRSLMAYNRKRLCRSY